jgi:uncharacterized protein
MRILFDLGHPAHVHLFKNLIWYFQKQGHKVTVVNRDKDLTCYLLDAYKIKHQTLSKAKTGFLGNILEFFERTIKILRLNSKEHFNLAIGTSVSISYLTLFYKVRSYVFGDNDDLFSYQFVLLAYPFATRIINPDCIKPIFFKRKRILYSSYQKFAYLHPNNFRPNKSVLKKYNLKPHAYILVRLSALKAYHDKKAIRLFPLLSQIKKMAKEYPVILSQENIKSDLNPLDLHDIIAFSKFTITDSHTLSTETACLGRPSLLYSNFKGRLSYTDELQNKYCLISIYNKKELSSMIDSIKELINKPNDIINPTFKKDWLKLIRDKIDLNQWMINFFDKEFKKI